MEKKLIKWVGIFMLLLLTACGQTKPKEELATFKRDVNQTITSGKIKGNLDKENDVLEWLGIPYAAAPVGELRWKEPQAVKDWKEVLDA
ncbi:carboxylesterase family protein, partial [Streptococcus pyogenes]